MPPYITQKEADTLFSDQMSLPAVKQSVNEIAEFCASNAAEIDQNQTFPAREFEMISSAGLLFAPWRTSLGGLGLGFESQSIEHLLLVLQLLGKANLSVARIYEGHVNALQLIQTFARSEQTEHFAENAKDQKIFGIWSAEGADGLKFTPLGHQKVRLTGAKTFCSGAGYIQRALVAGSLPDGKLQLCLVPMDEVDARIEPSWWTATGMRASLSGKVDFSGVVLDESWFIGNRNDYLRQPWLTLGVVRFAAVQLGGVQALVDTTRAFLKRLGRTEDPYQLARMGKMTVALETGRLWIESAGRKIRQFNLIFGGEPSLIKSSVELIAYANMVRTVMEQLAMEVIRDAERCLGTRGLLPPEPMERIVRDLRLYLRQPCFDAAIVNSGVFGFSRQPK